MVDETGILAIEEYEPGRYHLGRWVDDDWGPAGAHEVTADQLQTLCQLGYGQTFWVPNMSQPIFRFTGDHNGLDFCENSSRSPGALFFDTEELKTAIQEVLSAATA
jgi:hypothetical protein